ncbi:MAG: hypothetical protein N2C12_11765, partial [Planctomycetales bacterium]
MASLPHVLFLDSAQQGGQLGRYSFLAADPFHWIERTSEQIVCSLDPRIAQSSEQIVSSLDPRIERTSSFSDPFSEVDRLWRTYPTETSPGLPPFQGGLAGLFGYDLARSLERLPASKMDDLPTPSLALGCYDVVIAVDHGQGECWIIS